jgi:hypothetical protein
MMAGATLQGTTAGPRRANRGWLIAFGLFAIVGLLAAFAAYVAHATPAPVPAEAPPDPVMVRLTAVGDHLNALDATLVRLVEAVRRIQADVGEIKTKLNAPAPLSAPRPVVFRPRPAARTTMPVPAVSAAPPADDPRLLSVDLWDGKPSVALRGADGRVHFAQDGETTAQGRLSVGPLGSQSVRLERRDGTTAVLHAVEDR